MLFSKCFVLKRKYLWWWFLYKWPIRTWQQIRLSNTFRQTKISPFQEQFTTCWSNSKQCTTKPTNFQIHLFMTLWPSSTSSILKRSKPKKLWSRSILINTVMAVPMFGSRVWGILTSPNRVLIWLPLISKIVRPSFGTKCLRSSDWSSLKRSKDWYPTNDDL